MNIEKKKKDAWMQKKKNYCVLLTSTSPSIMATL